MRAQSRRTVLKDFLMIGAAVAVPSIVSAQSRGYRLLVERGVDTLCVQRLVTGRLGPPLAVDTIASDIATRPDDLTALAASATRQATIIIASPAIIHALGEISRHPTRREARLKADIGRALPAEKLDVVVFA